MVWGLVSGHFFLLYVSTLHATTNHHSCYYDKVKWLLQIEIFLHMDVHFCQHHFLNIILLFCYYWLVKKIYLTSFSFFTCKSKITSSTCPMEIMVNIGNSIMYLLNACYLVYLNSSVLCNAAQLVGFKYSCKPLSKHCHIICLKCRVMLSLSHHI